MAHISHARDVYEKNRFSLSQFLALSNSTPSFAAFCGSPSQRNAIALHGMQHYWGRMGIILLHNDAALEGSLARLQSPNPQLKTYLVNPMGSNTFYYDPFYGMAAEDIVNCIVPLEPGSFSSDSNKAVRSYLRCYLEIMQLQYTQNPLPFGNSPYNLDLLMDLVRMPFKTLKQSVLNFLPLPQENSITTLLSTVGAQQSAYEAVCDFADTMSTFLWTPRGFAGHSRMSITQAVTERCLISINITESRPALLDFLATEIQALINRGTPFLLIESGIQLNNSNRLKQIFYAEHQNAPYSTGIIADSLTGITDTTDQLAALLSQHPEFIVFACNNVESARPFSNAIGTYQRMVRETHHEAHREPFHIFSSHGRGRHEREVTENNVRPEELVFLRDGCLLSSNQYPRPILVKHFSL